MKTKSTQDPSSKQLAVSAEGGTLILLIRPHGFEAPSQREALSPGGTKISDCFKGASAPKGVVLWGKLKVRDVCIGLHFSK